MLVFLTGSSSVGKSKILKWLEDHTKCRVLSADEFVANAMRDWSSKQPEPKTSEGYSELRIKAREVAIAQWISTLNQSHGGVTIVDDVIYNIREYLPDIKQRTKSCWLQLIYSDFGVT